MTSVLFRICIGLLFFQLSGCNDEATTVTEAPTLLAINEIAPDFAFYSLHSTEPQPLRETLSSYRGKVIYLDFWASWCKPCLESMPLLNQMRGELVDENFEIIAVNLDISQSQGLEFIQAHPVDYPVVRTDNENINHLYQINGLPISFLIDRQGVLRHIHRGFKVQDMDKLRQRVEALINNGSRI